MPVIENLKNFVRERHLHHHHRHPPSPPKHSRGAVVPPGPRDAPSLEIDALQSQAATYVCSPAMSATQAHTSSAALPPPHLHTPPSRSAQASQPPSAAGFGGSAVLAHGEKAEAIIEAARLEKSKLPIFDGLPDHFTLLSKMGDGAFSNVFKAIDRRTGQKVAIKCVRKFELNRNQEGKHLNADLKKKPRATERANISKEVSIMRTLNHPSIVKLINFSESRDHYFLVLELMEGGELFHQIVKLTYFSEELARHVILQVARGIRYLHEEKGVVHRDIKPENLLFSSIPIIPSTEDKQRPYDEDKEDEGEFLPNVGGGGIGQVKIADFGLSKIVWAEDTATPCGTVGYTAPEIVKDERYSKSVDMWAMGCVLYTLLCGFPPFFDMSIQVLTEKVAKGYYTFLSPWWDDISDSSKDLITHLLCVDPEKRYTIDEFLAHPWCKEQAPNPKMNKQDAVTMAPHIQRAREMNYAPRDSPLLHAGGGCRTPGVAQLREAFDVTYAVHRMEEEGARRARFGAGHAGALHGLNEEDEEDEQGYEGGVQDGQQAVDNNSGLDWCHHEFQDRSAEDSRAAEEVLYSGQAGTRDQGVATAGVTRSGGKKVKTQGGGFELNIAHATLLGRRKQPH